MVRALAFHTFVLTACLLAALPHHHAQVQDAAQRLRQAAAFFDQGKYAEAATAAREARELDPQLLPAWKLCGLALQLAGQTAAAEAEFALALKPFPADEELWLYLSRVQYQQASLPQAALSVRQAVRHRPDFSDAHAQLGLTLEAAGELNDALTSYQRAIALNQQQGRAKALPLYQAGGLLARLGRFAEALELLTRAEKIEPRVSELRVARGRTLEQLGRLDEAEGEYRQAVALDGNAMARAHLERLKSGASGGNARAPSGQPAETILPIRFRNVAAKAGVNFTLRNAASPQKYLVETMTGGVAAFDYNNDGHTDIYFVNGATLPAMRKTSPDYWNRLFQNNGDGTFTDVTTAAKVAGEGYSMGVAAADYDNDGDQDLFVAGVNQNILFRNEGDGRFSDVTARARLAGGERRWSVAATWLDYDNDGRLDLFVVNYINWRPGIDPLCGEPGKGLRTYCLPDRYDGLPNQLFRNNGDGTFADVSQASGVAAHIGKGMGVAIADYDDDGFTDVFVANDTLPNFLFHNNGRGGFEEVALGVGVAFNDSGRAVSGMGVDFRDYDNDGRPDLIVSALEGETFPLFRNEGKGFFLDETWASGLGSATIKRSGWGLGLFDFNNDGFKDLLTVNAHVNDKIEQLNGQTYRQPLGVFANLGNGMFTDFSALAGESFLRRQARRGCAFADFNHDGQIDAVTTSLNEPAELLLNESAPAPGTVLTEAHHWLSLQLVGKRANRDGIGARVRLVTTEERTQFNHVTTSVGYSSSSDGRVHFGLGRDTAIKLLEIRWPGGVTQRISEVAVDRAIKIIEAY
jgi:tetratricopeptide (TPR) repeat protein